MIKCPVCDEYEFEKDSDYDVCDVCGWENDGLQYDDPDDWDGANYSSLNTTRLEYSLLKNSVTHAETQEARELYRENIGEIWSKLNNSNPRIDDDKLCGEFEKAHENYKNTLTAINQKSSRSEKKQVAV